MPRLEEFDLDAPLASKPKRLAFRAETRTVTALYERCLEEVTVPRGWKVLLECVPAVTNGEVRDLLGVLAFQVQFDVDQLDGLGTRAKKEKILDVLHAGVRDVAVAEQWPTRSFERARECVLERDFVNAWWWKKPKWNRGSTLRGQVWCSHEMDAFRAWLVVQDRRGNEVDRKQILETDPSEFEFVSKLGRARWTGSKRFVLEAKDHTEVGAIEVSE